MKIGICGDVHFSQFSSIIRSMGEKYSTRLENMIETLNWVEKTFVEHKVDCVVYLGDFFDKESLNSMEITALQEIEWNNLPHHFIVGNHESAVNNLEYNSTSVLKKLGFDVIDRPSFIVTSNTKIHFIPYITEDSRKGLRDYLDTPYEKNIIFSHNDVAGIQYGGFISKNGFTLDEIFKESTLYINGHLHNQEKFYENNELKLLNLGNITGQNFSEDAFRYKHQIAILDTDTVSIDYITNPHAINFYKIDLEKEDDLSKLSKLQNNVVLSIRCEESLRDDLSKKLEGLKSRIIAYKETFFKNSDNTLDSEKSLPELNSIDHLKQFKEFIINNLGATDVVFQELMEVCN